MPQDFQQMQRDIAELKAFMNNLKGNPTIPRDVAEAFKLRLGSFQPSTKSATAENQAVNEAGTGTYSVLKPPTGFKLLSPGVHIPYYGN